MRFIVKDAALSDTLLLFSPDSSTVTLVKAALYRPTFHSSVFLFMILSSKYAALFAESSQPDVQQARHSV